MSSARRRLLATATGWSLALLLFLPSVRSVFTEHFRQFLREKFGNEVEESLTRLDHGEHGSFGGGDQRPQHDATSRRPIVFVHGFRMKAVDIGQVAEKFAAMGYAWDELYGTTFGPSGSVIDVNQKGKANCTYVKAIRQLIEAVLKYTGHEHINVISYSMGVIVARKAILGGNCVDTDEMLGAPLTTAVHTFIGIAGPNHGARVCKYTTILRLPPCSKINGMACGSKYLADINATKHYEGKFVFVIQTDPDSIVGKYVCDDDFTSRIDGANEIITTYGDSHIGVYWRSAPLQYELIQRNEPPTTQFSTVTDSAFTVADAKKAKRRPHSNSAKRKSVKERIHNLVKSVKRG